MLRRRVGFLGYLALAAALVAWAPGSGTGNAEAGTESGLRRSAIVQAVERTQPCVVNISSEKRAASTSRWPFSAEENQRPRVNGMGSGVIVDQRGYILTNHHVVDKVQGIEVQLLDGTTYPGRVMQFDPVLDLALVKVDPVRPLPAISMGTSSDLMVGETVITIGNAFGYENTVSVGIVSALHRDVTLSDEQVYRNLIQTDASINPGNSGGPLINIDGELIGINVAVRAGAQGIGFALPIDEVKRVAAEMLSTRRLASTWHGLVAAEVRRAGRRVVVVTDIQQGSPAESTGLNQGDELVRIGDLAVTSVLDVERALLDARPGQPSKVVFRRGGADRDVTLDLRPLPGSVTVAAAPAADPADMVWEVLGVRTQQARPEFVAAVSNKLRGGLVIESVLPGSPAALASIQRGDILVGINVGTRHWETIRPDNILYVLRQPEASQNDSAVLYVVRRNGIESRRISLGETRVRKITHR